jgi:hypothetical protein
VGGYPRVAVDILPLWADSRDDGGVIRLQKKSVGRGVIPAAIRMRHAPGQIGKREMTPEEFSL